MIKEIELTQGKVTLVDDSDFEEINQYKWHFGGGYARRNKRDVDGSRKIVFLHRELMNTPAGLETDHINGEKLDNRRSNLRIVNKSMNQRNTKPRKGASEFKGVSFYKTKRHKSGYWIARIQISGKVKNLGYFKNELEAAKAYNEAAKIHYGEYALLNKLEELIHEP